MEDIDIWLTKFTKYWQKKDVKSVMSLFTDDVEYWETPFVRVMNKQDLQEEWENIYKQDDIKVEYDIFSSINNKSSVVWDLSFVDSNGIKQHFGGVYLIILDANNKCRYFYQCCEAGN